MQLSENFYLCEFVRSSTASRLGIDNTPGPEAIDNLTYLCRQVLQPVFDNFVQKGITLVVTSGFRCLELNRALKSKDSSQHITGCAVDFEIPGVDNYIVAKWIKDNLDFDQVILEYYTPGQPESGWVHVSVNPRGLNRKTCLTINSNATMRGLIK